MPRHDDDRMPTRGAILMHPGASARKLTYEDFVRFPDDGRRHELVNGVHYVTPSPAQRHQQASWQLSGALFNYLQAHPIGRGFAAPFDIVLSSSDVVEPDILVVLNDQLGILTDANVQGAPAIVIEILSLITRRRDFGIKRELYERAGVREYWIVDTDQQNVTVHRRPETSAPFEETVITLANADALTSPILPEFSLPLATLFGRS